MIKRAAILSFIVAFAALTLLFSSCAARSDETAAGADAAGNAGETQSAGVPAEEAAAASAEAATEATTAASATTAATTNTTAATTSSAADANAADNAGDTQSVDASAEEAAAASTGAASDASAGSDANAEHDASATTAAVTTAAAGARYGTDFSYSGELDENGYWKGIRALDYYETIEYRAIPIPYSVHYVPDEAFQGDIDYLTGMFAPPEQILDRAVADGDTVNIDFTGSVGGVEFEGGSTNGMGADVTIGVTSYIDDFLEQLIGHMPGDTVNVEVTFPDDYHEESLRSKDALFVTVVNYIADAGKAELTDDIVSQNLSEYYGWATVGEVKDYLRERYRRQAMQMYINQYLSNLEAVKPVPERLIAWQEQAMLAGLQNGADSNGMSFDEFMANQTGALSVDELLKENHEQLASMAAFSLAVQAIAEDAGFNVSDEDLVGFFTANTGSGDYSIYEEQYGLPWLKQNALTQKVMDYIADNAVLDDKD